MPTGDSRVALMAIALNEDPYIDEWIKYNLMIGFDHVYIYDNSEGNTLAYLHESYLGPHSQLPISPVEKCRPWHRCTCMTI